MRLVDMTRWSGKHNQETMFLIGNGPSLTYDKLDMIKGRPTIAMNNICLAYPHTDWRPTYYMNVTRSFRGYRHWRECGIKGFEGSEHSFIWAMNAPILAQYKLDIKVSLLSCHTMPLFSEYADASISRYGTSMFTALQIAYYMGAHKVYLLGCDLNYAKFINFETLESNRHFHPKYYGDEKAINQEYKGMIIDEIRTYDAHIMANYAFRTAGAMIYTTSHSSLENIYHYVPLEEAVKE